MSSGGLTAYIPHGEPVPTRYLLTLCKIVVASAVVSYFLLAFILFHARTYLREGWRRDNWFFRGLVIQLVWLALASVGLQSTALHWVLDSLASGVYARDALDWIDVVQRLLTLPNGVLANAFFTWRVIQISPSRPVYAASFVLWNAGAVGYVSAEALHIMTVLGHENRARQWRQFELIGGTAIFLLDLLYASVLSYRLWYARRNQSKPEIDPVSQYFVGTVQTSLLTTGAALGSLITVAFLHSAQIYLCFSFFLLVLPSCWTLAVLWALNQRVFIRRRTAEMAHSDDRRAGGNGGSDPVRRRQGKSNSTGFSTRPCCVRD
ncbi:hypothetical protein JCM10212_005888 [Sporobolomyces blumeae]